MTKVTYNNIEQCADKNYLYASLNDEILKEIDNILGAYFNGLIDFIEPRDNHGEPDFTGKYELVIKDKEYKPCGSELLVLEWIEDRENTDYLIDYFRCFMENDVPF